MSVTCLLRGLPLFFCAAPKTPLRVLGIIALDTLHVLRHSHCDSDVDTLFRILMQCQIIDDVVDYTEDVSAGLPSFLTASASLPQAMELTAEAARYYAASRERSSGNGLFPLSMALCVVTAVTKLVIRVADRRQRGTQ